MCQTGHNTFVRHSIISRSNLLRQFAQIQRFTCCRITPFFFTVNSSIEICSSPNNEYDTLVLIRYMISGSCVACLLTHTTVMNIIILMNIGCSKDYRVSCNPLALGIIVCHRAVCTQLNLITITVLENYSWDITVYHLL